MVVENDVDGGLLAQLSTHTTSQQRFTPGGDLPNSKADLTTLKHDLLTRLAEVQKAISRVQESAQNEEAPF